MRCDSLMFSVVPSDIPGRALFVIDRSDRAVLVSPHVCVNTALVIERHSESRGHVELYPLLQLL